MRMATTPNTNNNDVREINDRESEAEGVAGRGDKKNL